MPVCLNPKPETLNAKGMHQSGHVPRDPRAETQQGKGQTHSVVPQHQLVYFILLHFIFVKKIEKNTTRKKDKRIPWFRSINYFSFFHFFLLLFVFVNYCSFLF